MLSLLWIFTEIMYNHKMLEKAEEHRVPQVISRIDMPSILFFLGILMAVAVLQSTGILGSVAGWLDKEVHNVYIINIVLGRERQDIWPISYKTAFSGKSFPIVPE